MYHSGISIGLENPVLVVQTVPADICPRCDWWAVRDYAKAYCNCIEGSMPGPHSHPWLVARFRARVNAHNTAIRRRQQDD